MITFLIIWYIIGFLGCTLAWYSCDTDYYLDDLVCSLLFSISGPIMFIFGINILLKEKGRNVVLFKRKL